MAECEYEVCNAEATALRTVNGPHGHSWTTNVCEPHAKMLDAGFPMAVNVYALRLAEQPPS
jgi:hypothetical protein